MAQEPEEYVERVEEAHPERGSMLIGFKRPNPDGTFDETYQYVDLAEWGRMNAVSRAEHYGYLARGMRRIDERKAQEAA